VSPTSYTADNNNHTMKLLGSNFQSGDTLTFVDPEGGSIGSTAAKLTFVSSGEIDYQFNDGADSGSWNVRVNSPSGSFHSGSVGFTVGGGDRRPENSGYSSERIQRTDNTIYKVDGPFANSDKPLASSFDACEASIPPSKSVATRQIGMGVGIGSYAHFASAMASLVNEGGVERNLASAGPSMKESLLAMPALA
jgi:hypothetical protein